MVDPPEIALVALAAWNNVSVDKLPQDYRTAWPGPTLEAWKRVVDAVSAAEREACANLAEHWGDNHIAAAIRARKP